MLNPDMDSNRVVARASLQPMELMDILDTVFSLYRNHFRLILGICTVYFVLRLGVGLFTGISTFFLESSGMQGLVIAIDLVVAWFSFLIVFFSLGALLFIGARIYLGEHITAGAAFGQVARRFSSYLGSVLLWILVVAVLAITIIGIPFAIYFGIRWSFYGQAVLIEEASATSALKRSRELVRGAWWRVFGIMLAIFLLSFMIEAVLQFFLLFAFGFAEVISAEDGVLEMFQRMATPELAAWDGLVAYIIHSLINTAVAGLLLPLMPISVTLLYFDLRVRKEGFDVGLDVPDEEDGYASPIDLPPRWGGRNY